MIHDLLWAFLIAVFAVFAVFGLRRERSFWWGFLAFLIAVILTVSFPFAFADFIEAWRKPAARGIDQVNAFTSGALILAFGLWYFRWADVDERTSG